MKKYLLYFILFSIHIAAAADGFDYPEDLLSSLRNIYYFDVDSNSSRIQELIDAYIPDFYDARSKAVYLNECGYSLYEKMDYRAALPFFFYAMKTDSEYRYPFYNFVCTMGLLDKEYAKEPCHTLHPDETRIAALAHAIQLYPGYKQKMMIDPDLELYRNLPWFIELSGVDIHSQEGCVDILERSSTWFGLKPGIYPTSEIDFFKDGTLEMRFFSFSENEDGDYFEEWTTKKGMYEALSGGRIIINLDDGSNYIGEFEKKIFNQPVPYYYLILTNEHGVSTNSYCVYPDPCSA